MKVTILQLSYCQYFFNTNQAKKRYNKKSANWHRFYQSVQKTNNNIDRTETRPATLRLSYTII